MRSPIYRYMATAVLAVAIAALAAGCGDTDQEAPTDDSEPGTRLYLAGKQQLLVVDVDRETVERHEPAQLSPGGSAASGARAGRPPGDLGRKHGPRARCEPGRRAPGFL